MGGVVRRLAARGLGITHIIPPYKPMFFYDHWINPEVEDIVYIKKYSVEKGVKKIQHIFETPVGTISSVVGRNPNDNVLTSSPEIPFIKNSEDWRVLNYIFKRMISTMRPNYKEMELDQEDLGSSGFTIAVIDKTPFQRAWIEVASLELTIMDLKLGEEGFLEFVEIQEEFHKKAAEITAGCPSPHVLLIDNITNVISPKLYKKYTEPFYQLYSNAFRGTDKKLAVHFDGLFRHIKDEVRKSSFDIIDSFTVPPTGNVSVAEAKDFFPGKQIFINLPPHLARAEDKQLREEYSRIVDDWGSKVLTIEHVEDLPPEALEKHLSAALDVCGYSD